MGELVAGLNLAAPSAANPLAPWANPRFGEKLLRRLADWYGHEAAHQLKEAIIAPALTILRSKGKIDATAGRQKAKGEENDRPRGVGGGGDGGGGGGGVGRR